MESNVIDMAAARRDRWLRILEAARERGDGFMFNQELEQPARVIRFPLELVQVEPPEPVA